MPGSDPRDWLIGPGLSMRFRLIWLADAGKGTSHFDVHDYIALARSHYAANGVGADCIDTLFR